MRSKQLELSIRTLEGALCGRMYHTATFSLSVVNAPTIVYLQKFKIIELPNPYCRLQWPLYH